MTERKVDVAADGVVRVLDVSTRPVVRLNNPGRTLSAAESAALLEDLQGLLAAGARYGVINPGGPPDLPPPWPGELARWFKAERSNLGRLCAGMAMVIVEDSLRAAVTQRVAMAASHDLYPYAVELFDGEHAALTWIEARLS
jgi:hypothetical protein